MMVIDSGVLPDTFKLPQPVKSSRRSKYLMVEILPYAREHLHLIKSVKFPGVREEDLTHWEGKGISILDNGNVLAVFGLRVAGQVGIVGAFIDDSIRPIVLHRLVKRSIPGVMRYFGLKAIKARAFGERNRNWLKRLGFVDDGQWMRLDERR